MTITILTNVNTKLSEHDKLTLIIALLIKLKDTSIIIKNPYIKMIIVNDNYTIASDNFTQDSVGMTSNATVFDTVCTINDIKLLPDDYYTYTYDASGYMDNLDSIQKMIDTRKH